MARLHFSKLNNQPLLTASGSEVGKIVDGVVKLVDGGLPTVTGVLVHRDGKDVFVSARDLSELSANGGRLRTESVDSRPFERRPGEVLLEGDVQGHSVIDVDAARLVRVKDLVLEGEQGSWRVVGIVPSPPSRLLAAFGLGRVQQSEIDWARVEPLVSHVPSAQVGPSSRLAKLRPADIADIVEEASHDEGEEILDAVQHDHELEADVFEELDEEHQLEFIKGRSREEVATILANMDPDAATDMLMELDQEQRRPVLELLPPEQQAKVRKLLGYNPETAGGLMSNEFIALPSALTVEQSIRRLRELEDVPATLTTLYTLVDGRLSGAVGLAELLCAEVSATLLDLSPSDPIAVYADADLPSVAVQMADYNLSSLPVVDEQGGILGVVSYDDLLEAMLPEEWRWRGRPEQARRYQPPKPAENDVQV
ncbi:MAG: CBS domain-containing protein [Candidatus Dormibacteraeota bacterium]|nr:CBS domain-containing protein [Candidatus Dormibacteraeota bacterium]